jgi:hypothetical protein
MNYLSPRQLRPNLWVYTVENKYGVHLIGYCAENCGGHSSPEGACEHYKHYLIDKAIYHGDSEHPKSSFTCEVKGCKEITDGCAELLDESFYDLCKNHRNKETLKRIVRVDESWHYGE